MIRGIKKFATMLNRKFMTPTKCPKTAKFLDRENYPFYSIYHVRMTLQSAVPSHRPITENRGLVLRLSIDQSVVGGPRSKAILMRHSVSEICENGVQDTSV